MLSSVVRFPTARPQSSTPSTGCARHSRPPWSAPARMSVTCRRFPVFIVGMDAVRHDAHRTDSCQSSAGVRRRRNEALRFGGKKGIRGPSGFPRRSFRKCAFVMTEGDLRRILGQSYTHRNVGRLAPAAGRITDKMQSNFIFDGIIHLMLPHAAIIHTVRDPVDTCLSCFSKLFVAEQNHTYDLAELGQIRSPALSGTLMLHWHEVLPPGRILDVRYEDVVADLESQARRVIAHCGLPWDDRCLAFHETERPVRTSSATQVRQPIYNSSIGRWRDYEPIASIPFAAENRLRVARIFTGLETGFEQRPTGAKSNNGRRRSIVARFTAQRASCDKPPQSSGIVPGGCARRLPRASFFRETSDKDNSGEKDNSDEKTRQAVKRTYQPSKLVRKRRHGFRTCMAVPRAGAKFSTMRCRARADANGSVRDRTAAPASTMSSAMERLRHRNGRIFLPLPPGRRPRRPDSSYRSTCGVTSGLPGSASRFRGGSAARWSAIGCVGV